MSEVASSNKIETEYWGWSNLARILHGPRQKAVCLSFLQKYKKYFFITEPFYSF